jgi:hypothetical protein
MTVHQTTTAEGGPVNPSLLGNPILLNIVLNFGISICDTMTMFAKLSEANVAAVEAAEAAGAPPVSPVLSQEQAALSLWAVSSIAPPPTRDREEVRNALMSALSTCTELEPHWNALADLFRALQLLDQGIVAPMLCPKKFQSRPPKPAGEEILASLLLWGCTALSRLGLSDDQAMDLVCSLASQNEIRIGGGKPIERTTLRSWRKKKRLVTIATMVHGGKIPQTPTTKAVLEILQSLINSLLSGDDLLPNVRVRTEKGT